MEVAIQARKNPVSGLTGLCGEEPLAISKELEGKIPPEVDFRFLFLAAATFARFLIIATEPGLAKGSFAIEFLFQPTQSFVNGLTFFQTDFGHGRFTSILFPRSGAFQNTDRVGDVKEIHKKLGVNGLRFLSWWVKFRSNCQEATS